MSKWNFNGARGNQQTTITDTNETTIVTAYTVDDKPNVLLDVYAIIIGNTSNTATNVTIRDDTAGTKRFVIPVPAGEVRGFVLEKDSAHKQLVANKPWTAQCSVGVSSIEVTVLFVKN